MNDFTPGLYDYWILLRKYLLFIILVTCLGTSLAFYLVFFVIKPTYEATVSLLPHSRQLGQGSAFLATLEPNLENFAPLRSLLGERSNQFPSLNDYASILRSRMLTEKVLDSIPITALIEVQPLLEEIEPR